MRPENLLIDEFLKQFKSHDTLNDFLGQLQKRGIEKMLEGELDALGGMTSMNSHSILTPVMAMEKRGLKPAMANRRCACLATETLVSIAPATRPMIVPKRENMVDGIEEVIVSLYAKGMSIADIEDQIRDVYNFELLTSTISRITSRIAEDIVSWQNRPWNPFI